MGKGRLTLKEKNAFLFKFKNIKKRFVICVPKIFNIIDLQSSIYALNFLLGIGTEFEIKEEELSRVNSEIFLEAPEGYYLNIEYVFLGNNTEYSTCYAPSALQLLSLKLVN